MNVHQLLQNPVILNELVVALKANPNMAIHLVRQAAPTLFNDLDRLRDVLYRTLTGEQQSFLTGNFSQLANFMESTEGNKQLTTLIDSWKEFSKPKE